MELSKPDLYDCVITNSSLSRQTTFVYQAVNNRENEIRLLMTQEHRLLAKKSLQDLGINELQELRSIHEKLKSIDIEMQILHRNAL